MFDCVEFKVYVDILEKQLDSSAFVGDNLH